MALAAIAKAELDRKIATKLIPEFIEPLRELIKTDKALKCPMDEKFLLRFLTARDYKVDRAFELIQNYYKMRQDAGYFSTLYPSAHHRMFENNIMTVLKQKDYEGRTVIYINSVNWDPYKCNIDVLFPFWFLLMEELTLIPDNQNKGIVMLVCQAAITVAHCTAFTLKFMKTYAAAVRNSYPFKLKGLVVVNNPLIFDVVWNVMKHFLSEKILSRTHMSSDLGTLHELMDPQGLPKNLGGPLETDEAIDFEIFEKIKQRGDDYYKEQLKFGYGYRDIELEELGDKLGESTL